MNKLALVIFSIVILSVYAAPEAPQFVRKPFRPVPPRFAGRLVSRQEQSPAAGSGENQGYNYPKPEYGTPEEQQPPTTEGANEFTTEAEAEAVELAPATTVDQAAVDLLKQALQNRRIIYLGVPERQVEFEEIVYYPTVRETLVEYQPYTAIDTEIVLDSVEVLQIPQPAYAYSSQYFERFFKK